MSSDSMHTGRAINFMARSPILNPGREYDSSGLMSRTVIADTLYEKKMGRAARRGCIAVHS
jgi:hypothetical protein